MKPQRVAVLAAMLTAAWPSNAGPDGGAVRSGPLRRGEVGRRLRVFGRPGDPRLRSPDAVAVVRKRDGVLVDFWRRGAHLPTLPQLGTTADIDGLWRFQPVVVVGKREYAVVAKRTVTKRGVIEAVGRVTPGKTTLEVTTTYRLDPKRPRLVIESRLVPVSGPDPQRIAFGDTFKWGNVTYYVGGLPVPRMKHEGDTSWIGRRGAGGDLLLRPLGKPRMRVKYGARIRGFQGAITATYHDGAVPKAGVSVRRELVWETLPLEPSADGRSGELQMDIRDERGKPLAAKVRVDRLGTKREPFPDGGGLDGASEFLWTGNGSVRSTLPEGRYRLFVTAGYERAASQHDVRIAAGKPARVDAQLPRAVATPGWVAADVHLHQAPSVDADIGMDQRVVSIAAEGVEFAVATDHYVVTDLAPTVKRLERSGALTQHVQTMPGCEVSTLGHRFGHFNVFPLKPGAVVRFLDTDVDTLFRDARKKSPGGLLQVNHPRWPESLGYFTYFGIDDDTGAMSKPGYNPDFDTIEVYNGDDARDPKKVRRVMKDWIHLLGRGRRYAATGSSDSHNLAFLDPGLPRTMVRHGANTGDARDARAQAKSIVAALKAGHSYVTSGPLLDVTVAGKGPGETARATGGSARVHIVVRAAPWVDVGAVEVLVGGRGRQHRYIGVPKSRSATRLDTHVDVPVRERTFVIVVARGGRKLPNASRFTIPFAFTNPIWLEP